MKKLQELTGDKLIALYENNKDFAALVYEYAYSNAMDMQADDARSIGCVGVFNYNDYYNSFYYTAPDPELVAGRLDADYLTPENAENYRKLCEKIDAWENLDADAIDLYGCALYDEAQALADELARGITAQLRAYENITDDDVTAELDAISAGYSGLSDLETDGVKVYKTTVQVYA